MVEKGGRSLMRIYRLNRAVFSIKNNAAQFLNGLTANTLDQPRNAFLDVHGKIIATFDQIRFSDDHFLIILEKPFRETLLNHIERFLRLGKVILQEEDYEVYFDLDGQYPLEREDFAVPQKKGRLILTRRNLPDTIFDREFTLFRLKNTLPLHGVDYHNVFLLNVSEEEFVSFTKGCFLGQEPVAKVHNRSQPSWKLVVRYEDECSQDQKTMMTSKTTDPQTKRVLGFIFVRTA